MCNTDTNGHYEIVDSQYRNEANVIFDDLDAFQKRHGEENLAHMSVKRHYNLEVAIRLGYNNVNKNNHGWTALDDTGRPLVVKTNRLGSDSWVANFADSSKDKILEFGKKKVEVALAVVNGANTIEFIVHGYNDQIPQRLLAQYNKAMNTGGKRHSQVFTLGRMLFIGGFTIKCVNMSQNDVEALLKARYPRLSVTNSMFD